MRHHFFALSIIAATLVATPALAAGPSIGTVFYPSSVTASVAVTLSAYVSSSVGIQSCKLFVDSEDLGAMMLSGSTASMSYTFPRGGVFTTFVFCKDGAGGMASGPNTSVFVQGAIVQTPIFGGGSSSAPASPVIGPTSVELPQATSSTVATSTIAAPVTPRAGSLVKLACTDGAGADHPCTAVYFVGVDGTRRAFPNAKAYFSWYANFDAVTTVSLAELSMRPLGKNVTYRPGVRMIKFQTLNHVYAVSAGGVLRWITTESVASALYGADWNKKIDDVSDAFYTNYTFGADVASADAFSPVSASESATAIDASTE